jgi:hypothetical protein
MSRLRLPPWIRRALQAALVATAIAVLALAADFLDPAGPPFVLPTGFTGVLILVPPVLALAVIPISYPVALAATRSDALLGAVAAFLIAADVTLLVLRGRIVVINLGVEMPAGLFAALLALGPAVAGLVASQVAAPLGFGRRAGAWAAVISALGAIGLVIVVTGAA